MSKSVLSATAARTRGETRSRSCSVSKFVKPAGGRLGEQFLRQPHCPRLVALDVGIGAGRDVFLDPGLDPPQEALMIAHPSPASYSGPVSRATVTHPIFRSQSA